MIGPQGVQQPVFPPQRELKRPKRRRIGRPYKMLYDLTGIDERVRTHREGEPDSAPVMMMNEDLHVDLTTEKIDELLKRYR